MRLYERSEKTPRAVLIDQSMPQCCFETHSAVNILVESATYRPNSISCPFVPNSLIKRAYFCSTHAV